MAISEEVIRDALRTVIDPELGMNVVDLGLVYEIDTAPEHVHVRMTMTTPACPMTAMIVDDASSAISAAAPSIRDIQVELVWDPPWEPGMMSAHAKQQFGW